MKIMKSIKGRLFFWFFTFDSSLLIILGFFLYEKIKDIVFESVDRTLHSKIQIIAGLLHEEYGVIELELSEIVSGEYSMPRSGHYYKVILDGKVLAASPSLVDNDFNLIAGTLQSSNKVLNEKVYVSTILIGGVVGSWITKQSLKPLENFSLEVSQINYNEMSKGIE